MHANKANFASFVLAIYTVNDKTSPFYFSNNSVKNLPILLFLGFYVVATPLTAKTTDHLGSRAIYAFNRRPTTLHVRWFLYVFAVWGILCKHACLSVCLSLCLVLVILCFVFCDFLFANYIWTYLGDQLRWAYLLFLVVRHCALYCFAIINLYSRPTLHSWLINWFDLIWYDYHHHHFVRSNNRSPFPGHQYTTSPELW